MGHRIHSDLPSFAGKILPRERILGRAHDREQIGQHLALAAGGLTARARPVVTCLLLVFAMLLLAASLAPPAALAWQGNGDKPFPSRTVTWYGISPSSRPYVRTAALAINATGARVKLVEATRASSANIVILRPGPDTLYGRTPCTGTDTNRIVNGRRTPSYITWRPCIAVDGRAVFKQTADDATALLFAHEIMHALGLAHEPRRCATMNSPSIGIGPVSVPIHCAAVATAAPSGYYYCRLVQADDQSGLLSIYGGTRRPLTPAYCPVPGLALPTTLDVVAVDASAPSSYPDWRLRVTWSGLGADASGLLISAASDGCRPKGAAHDPSAMLQGPFEVIGSSGSFDIQAPVSGTWCVDIAAYAGDHPPFSSRTISGVGTQRSVPVVIAPFVIM